MQPKRIHLIAAARPNFMKVAPLYHALAQEKWCMPHIVHTGQHYDANMSDAFFRDLRLPEPAHHLEVGSGTHAEQTGRAETGTLGRARSLSGGRELEEAAQRLSGVPLPRKPRRLRTGRPQRVK